MAVIHQNGFSTAVRITLEVQGRVLRVAQVGPTSLILKEVIPIEPGTPARVVVRVDDLPHISDIILHEGIRDREVFFQDAV